MAFLGSSRRLQGDIKQVRADGNPAAHFAFQNPRWIEQGWIVAGAPSASIFFLFGSQGLGGISSALIRPEYRTIIHPNKTFIMPNKTWKMRGGPYDLGSITTICGGACPGCLDRVVVLADTYPTSRSLKIGTPAALVMNFFQKLFHLFLSIASTFSPSKVHSFLFSPQSQASFPLVNYP